MKKWWKSRAFLLLCYLLVAEGCEEREKNLAIFEIVKESLAKANDNYRTYANCEINSTDFTQPEPKEKTLIYLDRSIQLMTEIRNDIQFGPRPEQKIPFGKPIDCFEVLKNGKSKSGVYTVWPRSPLFVNRSLDVYCDMDTADGGWTVIQRRGNFNPQTNFNQGWHMYKIGFGDVARDFWLGNDNIYALSNQAVYRIRFDLKDIRGNTAYAIYHVFRIEDETDKYRLKIDKYSGNAGDSMNYHNNMQFSTKDSDNDMYPSSCARERRGGWWFNKCSYANLNGLYQPGVMKDFKSVDWYFWIKDEGLAGVEIKLGRI